MSCITRSQALPCTTGWVIGAIDYAGVLQLPGCKERQTLLGQHELFSDCHGAPLIVDDTVYVETVDGRVVIVGLSPDPDVALRRLEGGFDPLQQVEMDMAVYCSPIFANSSAGMSQTSNTLYAIASDIGDEGLKPSRADSPETLSSASKTRDRASRAVFVPTPQDIVEKMLELAKIAQTDVIYDLGSGDGRIVITAAKKYGCRSVGYESDKELVELSRSKAEAAGVPRLATFELSDLFNADLSDADVIVMYLLPSQLEKLLPRLEKVKPGVRIVAHHFGLPGVRPDSVVKVKSSADSAEHTMFLWTTPVKKEKK